MGFYKDMERKRYLKKIMIGMAAILAIANFSFALPIQAAEEETISGTIEVSANIGEEDMRQYIEDFEKKYPQVTVKYHYYEDYEETIKQKLPSGDYGDVLFVPSFVTADQYATYFAPLGDYPTLVKKYNYLETSKYEGHTVYGIPSSAYLAGILYNKDVFYQAGITETPKSIDEFLTDLEYIKERTDAIPFYTNYSAAWSLTFWEHFPYIEMTGNPDYREIEFVNEHNPFLEGSTHYEVYKLLYDIVQNGLCEKNPLMSNWELSKVMLNQGRIGCIAIGSWAVSQVKAAGPNADSIGFMPFPNEIDGRQYMTISTDYCYAVNKNSKNKEAAKAYINFMLDESGYALDHETLSIVRTDPYPDSYGNMENVILLSSTPATGDSYQKKMKLSAKLDMSNTEQAKRVIEAAVGVRKEDFDDIARDWNNRWESSRTPDMELTERSGSTLKSDVIVQNYEIKFSQTEQEYLQSIDNCKVGYLKNEAPMAYENQDGFTGLSSEICEIIEEKTGLTFSYYGFENREQMMEALREGVIDIVAGADKNAEYGEDIKYSKEYVSSMKVIVKNDTINSSDLEHNRIGIVKGEKSSYFDEKNGNYKEYNTLSMAIKAVENMEADYVITNYYSADYYIREQECSHVTIVPLSEMHEWSFAFSEDVDTRLVSICNKCIYGIPNENIQIMLREYADPPVQPVTVKRFVEANPFICLIVLSSIFLLIVVTIIVIMREKDRSAKKHALDVKRYELLASMVNEYIFEYDYQTNTIRFDQKFEKTFPYGKQLDLSSYQYDNEELNIVLDLYQQIKNSEEDITREFQLTDRTGKKQWYRLLAHTICDSNGKPQHTIGKIMNAQKEVEEKLRIAEKAQRDPLTGLYNREGFAECFDKMYAKLDDDIPVTFAVMDFDNFKSVNDVLGHAGGDEALLLFSRKLEKVFDGQAILARYGGDEFMLCMSGVREPEVRNIFSKLIQEMDMEFTYQAVTKHISISLGAVYAMQKLPFTVLFKEADKVLYKTKSEGKNNYRLIHHLDEI